MITVIRRNQRWLLLIVAILTIIAFAWLYNTTDTEQLGANRVAQMYGKTVYQVDVDRAVRLQQLAAILGMNDFLAQLSSTAQSQEQALEEFVWNLLVLRHEAEKLWVAATDEQVLEGIRNLPALRGPGGFDPARYRALLQEQMAPRGLTERHLEQLVRDSLALQKLRQAVVSPIGVTRRETEASLRFYQKTDVVVAKLPAPAEGEKPAVSDEDVESFYAQNRAGLLTRPLRGVAVAELALPEADRQLEGRARVDALQKVADAVSALHEKLAAPDADFAALAIGAGASYRVAPPFDAQGNTRGENPAEPGPPAGLPHAVVSQAFRLTPAQPVSEIIQSGDSFYVVKLLEEVPARELTPEEARPQILGALERQKLDEAQRKKAEASRASVVEAVAAGQNFADAARAQGLSVEELDGLEPWSQEMGPNLFYGRAAAEMEEGETGEVQRGIEGYLFLHLAKRHPLDDETRQQRQREVRDGLLGAKQYILFQEWLRLAREKSDLRFFAQGR